jgi:hypothetical protein
LAGLEIKEIISENSTICPTSISSVSSCYWRNLEYNT